MKKILIINKLLMLMLIIATLSASAFFLINTQIGLNILINVTQKILPGKLEIKEAEGKFAGPFKFKKLSYQNSFVNIAVDNLELDWHLGLILNNKIYITKLYADNLTIQSFPKNPSNKATINTDIDIKKIVQKINLPLKIQFDDLKINHITWSQSAKKLVLIDSITASSNFKNITNFTLNSLAKSQNAFLKIDIEIQKNWNLSWQLDIKKLNQIFPQISGSLQSSGAVTGPIKFPQINAKVNANNTKYLNISSTHLISNIQINFAEKQNAKFDFDVSNIKFDSYALDKISLNGTFTQNPQKLTITLQPTTLTAKYDDKPKKISIQKSLFEFLAAKHDLQIKSVVNFAEHQLINLNLMLTNALPLTNINRAKIAGKISLAPTNITQLPLFSSDLDYLKGKVSAEINLSGTFQHPEWAGNYIMDQGSLELPDLAITLKNIRIDASNKNSSLTYNIKMFSGAGTLTAKGKTNLSSPDFLSEAIITGSNFLLSDTSEYKIIANTELKLLAKKQGIWLSGKVFVPEATIKPKDLNSDSSLPSEVVFETSAQKSQTKIPDIYSTIDLTLGDNVNIDIMNLKGKAQGQLHINDESKKETTAFGNLTIKDATYNAYAERLTVTSGFLRFAGSIQNPSLNMQAIRDFTALGAAAIPDSSNNILSVGLKVYGPLDNLQTNLFSVPAGLNNTDILSYLVLGQPSSQISTNNIQLLLKAANALNFSGVGDINKVIDKLKEKLGLSEFGLTEETQTYKIASPDQKTIPSPFAKPGENLRTTTAFVLGKYLTPRIYISYSMGLIEAVNIFRIKYILSKHISIQSENSTNGNGADLLFSFQKE